MKRLYFIFIPFVFIYLLSACTPAGHMNILLFTDRLSDITDETRTLSDYIIADEKYKLLIENDIIPLLLTAEENDKGELVRVNLSLSKVDENGKPVKPTDEAAVIYFQKAVQLLEAFTLLDEEKCSETAEKILPLKGEDLLKTGELTYDTENYHLVYYSNKIFLSYRKTK